VEARIGDGIDWRDGKGGGKKKKDGAATNRRRDRGWGCKEEGA